MSEESRRKYHLRLGGTLVEIWTGYLANTSQAL